VVATAHPAKFDHIVEKAIGARISVPPSLEALLELPTNYKKIEPNISVLNSILND
jgi:threonine synthase